MSFLHDCCCLNLRISWLITNEFPRKSSSTWNRDSTVRLGSQVFILFDSSSNEEIMMNTAEQAELGMSENVQLLLSRDNCLFTREILLSCAHEKYFYAQTNKRIFSMQIFFLTYKTVWKVGLDRFVVKCWNEEQVENNLMMNPQFLQWLRWWAPDKSVDNIRTEK